MTQNNRGALLSDLATLPGEDRAQRLRQALDAYDQALRFITPDTAPLAFASTQNNRGTLLSELATLPGEDRGQRLRQALDCLRPGPPLSHPRRRPPGLRHDPRESAVSLRGARGDARRGSPATAGAGSESGMAGIFPV